MNGIQRKIIWTCKSKLHSRITVGSRLASSEPTNINNNNVIRSPFSVPSVKEPLLQFLFKDIRKYAKNNALVCGITGQTYTYEQLEERTYRFGSGLVRRGVTKDDVVGIMIPNCPDFAVVYLGSIGQGVTLTTFSASMTSHEVGRQLEMTEPKMMFTTRDLYPTVQEAANSIGSSVKIFAIDDEPIKEFLNDDGSMARRTLDINPTDHVAVLPFSSGTTGKPKGVMLTHSNLAINMLQHIHPEITDYKDGDCFLGVLPFSHAYGQMCIMLSALKLGLSIITLPKFESSTVLSALREHRPSQFHMVPPIINYFLNSPDVKKDDLRSIRNIVSGAAPISLNMAKDFQNKFEHPDLKLLSGWGMTEFSPIGMHEPWKDFVIGKVGIVVPSTEAKVVDITTGESLGPNQAGELYVRGPQRMKGYYKNPKATEETIDADGWLHTGDVATYDDKFHFEIVDRIKDLIKVKGMQVAPAELEDLLLSHPDIKDAAVIGVPHDRHGEVPKAFVVLKDGGSSVAEDDVKNYVAGKVASYKHLTGGVQIVSSIPKSPTGKILRKDLRTEK